jgi:hypothetical protein
MRPPQHNIDAPAVYVMPEDPAWDKDRIEAEVSELDEEQAADHPYVAYLRGDTRFDLRARVMWAKGEGSASDYLTGEPTRFFLQRLSVSDFAEVQDTLVRELKREGESAAFNGVWLRAAKYGIKSIEGDPDLTFPAGRPPESVMRGIVDKHGGLVGITHIGLAAWKLSKPLSDAEKKL